MTKDPANNDFYRQIWHRGRCRHGDDGRRCHGDDDRRRHGDDGRHRHGDGRHDRGGDNGRNAYCGHGGCHRSRGRLSACGSHVPNALRCALPRFRDDAAICVDAL